MFLCIDFVSICFPLFFLRYFYFSLLSHLFSSPSNNILLSICLSVYVTMLSVYISIYVIYLYHYNSYYTFPCFTRSSVPCGSLPKGEIKIKKKKRRHNFHFKSSNFLFSHLLLSYYLFIIFEMPWLFLLLTIPVISVIVLDVIIDMFFFYFILVVFYHYLLLTILLASLFYMELEHQCQLCRNSATN